MIKIDFNKTKPNFVNDVCKWYIDKELQTYIETKNNFNLPAVKRVFAFVVKSDEIEDYLLIDDKQNIIASYYYNSEGFEQMIARINIIKINKHYDESERVDI